MYRKNTPGQSLGFRLVNASTGAALTGATVTVYRSIDGGAQAAATGTVAERGNGQYAFAPSAADLAGNAASFLFLAAGAVPEEKTVLTTAADPTDAQRFGLAALPAGGTLAVKPAATVASGDGADAASLLARLTATRAGYLDNLAGGAVALASQIPAGFTAATFASAGVFSAAALANAPAGGGSSGATLAQIQSELDARGLTATTTARIDVATSTRLAAASYVAPASAAAVAGAVWQADVSAGYVGGQAGAVLYSRLAAAGYVAPDNTTLGYLGGLLTTTHAAFTAAALANAPTGSGGSGGGVELTSAAAIDATTTAPTATSFRVSGLAGAIGPRCYLVWDTAARRGPFYRVQSFVADATDATKGLVTLRDPLPAAPAGGDAVRFGGRY